MSGNDKAPGQVNGGIEGAVGVNIPAREFVAGVRPLHNRMQRSRVSSGSAPNPTEKLARVPPSRYLQGYRTQALRPRAESTINA